MPTTTTARPSTNHAVLVVGWDDTYRGKQLRHHSSRRRRLHRQEQLGHRLGATSGYFYVSYYDARLARTSYAATFEGAESAANYDAIYQYDPLGDVDALGAGTSTLWGANVFTANANSSLSAVGFYAEAPNTTYAVYAGSSLASLGKVASGTQANMGFHTVRCSPARALTGGSTFVVAVKLTTPGWNYPIAIEYPVSGYSSAATAQAGQSYLSGNGTSWTDLTTVKANGNVCLKAYASFDVTPPVTSATGLQANRHRGLEAHKPDSDLLGHRSRWLRSCQHQVPGGR